MRHPFAMIVLSILLLAFAQVLIAGEVTQNTDHSSFSTLQENFKAVEENIVENGTIRLTGALAENLLHQVKVRSEVARAESQDAQEGVAQRQGITPPSLTGPWGNSNRSPAIVSADSILKEGAASGEVQALDYPSYGVPGETTKWGDELPLKMTGLGVGGVGNLNSVASAIRPFEERNAGKLPIPYRVAPRDEDYSNDVAGTTFGKNPSDESSISNLVKSDKNLKTNLAEESERQELEKLKDKDKEKEEKEEKEKKEKESKETMSKIKELSSPYTMNDYYDVRDFFGKDPKGLAPLLEGDPAFQEKASDIFGYRSESASKSLGEMDADSKKKKAYAEFVDEKKDSDRTKGQEDPGSQPKRIRVERAH